MKLEDVVIGRHYALIDDNGNPAPALVKVYNVNPDGSIGGLIFNILTGAVEFTTGFRPEGPLWDEFNKISQDCLDRDSVMTVRAHNLNDGLPGQEVEKGGIPNEDLKEIERQALTNVRYFFSDDTSRPLSYVLYESFETSDDNILC